ncbi:MAG TPA: hypothetical protein VGI40_04710 [Pirellulaceae bacterium]|jgi:regulation of enolase protein 1 (concanavalin A-like superfamily)
MKPGRFTEFACIIGVFFARVAAAADLPAPWQHQDIGAATVAGTARAAEGVFTLQGTLDIWGNSDGCHFAWQKLKGDGTIVARVLSIENTQGHAKGGVAIRESLAADARQASMVDTPADGTQFLVREETGGKTTSEKTALNKGTMPYWLKLVRHGDKITGYESLDGRDWKQTGTVTLKMAEEVYVGLVASSHVKDKLCAAAFDNVSIGKNGK